MQDVRPTYVDGGCGVYPCFVCISRRVSSSLFLHLYLHSVGLSQRSEQRQSSPLSLSTDAATDAGTTDSPPGISPGQALPLGMQFNVVIVRG